MGFSLRPGLVLFSADRPGNYATLFSPAGRHAFRGDYASFDDVGRQYTWGFRYERPLRGGDRFVFAVADWQSVGEVREGRIVEVGAPVRIARGESGEPSHIEEDLRRLDALDAVVEIDAESEIAPDLYSRLVGAPRVSVLTCAYNRPAMLREAHESLRAQTSPDWEHLVFDAGSTDGEVGRVLGELGAVEPRLRAFRSEANVDQPARYWNNLLDRARGRYVCLLDDDNTKMPHYVEVMAGALDARPDLDMVTCGMVMIDSLGRSHPHQMNLETASEIERRSTVDSGAFMARRESLERIGYFPLDIRTNEDWAMMRRAVACLKIEHLGQCLTTWREHGGQRMKRCQALGNERDRVLIQGRGWSETMRVAVHHPPLDRLTESQQGVVGSVGAGIREIPWVREGEDVAVVLMPFRLESREVDQIAARSRVVVLVHSEDPYALAANTERLRWFLGAGKEVWVVTNDTACADAYRGLVGERVLVCPSLSVDARASKKCPPMAERPHDAVLVGHAYPSRVKFVRALGETFDLSRLRLRGDGWRQAGFVNAAPTVSFLETSLEYAEARAVVCLHRQDKDCGDSPHDPRLVQRGYVEGSRGARVFVDRTRPDHGFDPGEVVWFGDARDLGARLSEFLALADEEQEALAASLRRRALSDFTYRARFARVLNCVRSPRFDAVIP